MDDWTFDNNVAIQELQVAKQQLRQHRSKLFPLFIFFCLYILNSFVLISLILSCPSHQRYEQKDTESAGTCLVIFSHHLNQYQLNMMFDTAMCDLLHDFVTED